MISYIFYPKVWSDGIIREEEKFKVSGKPSVRFDRNNNFELNPTILDGNMKFVFFGQSSDEVRGRVQRVRMKLEERNICPITYSLDCTGARVQTFYNDPVKRDTLKSECFKEKKFPQSLWL